ncbi:hypothetical protein [Paenibacillus sp. SN-8-1]|uniref:hypothetical protein n=1 Tax=Paenibacillus sp. SN-8-1 TaxID=3435409 RepID=UPI003D9A7CB2
MQHSHYRPNAGLKTGDEDRMIQLKDVAEFVLAAPKLTCPCLSIDCGLDKESAAKNKRAADQRLLTKRSYYSQKLFLT